MNQRKLVLYIASSLDGYIATEDEDLEWILTTEGEGDNGYSKFYNTVDTILLGRKTYDWIMEHEGNNFPYKGKECYVFSRTERSDTDDVTFLSDDLVEFTKKLKVKAGKNIWLIGGGNLLDIFLKAQLVDEIILNIAPILLGSGIPLFKQNNIQNQLLLTEMNRYNQFAELHYQVVKKS